MGGDYCLSGVLCCLYILLSGSIINFNKYMMSPSHFPYAIPLTAIHTVISCTCCFLLYRLVPALFPSMAALEGKKMRVIQYSLPLSGLFAVGVVCSNYAYMYCSVAFLQFMKQTNVAWVFFLSCIVGSQICDRPRLANILLILSGVTMAVRGEMHFVLTGFIIQAVSQAGECGKNVMQEWMMGGSDFKLDPLTYNLFVQPLTLALLLVGVYFTWKEGVVAKFFEMWPLLLLNGLNAFFLNVTISTLIKHTSAMTFMLAGIVKDILIVMSSSYLFGNSVAFQQYVGFGVATCGIVLWSLMKMAPESFAVQAFHRLLCVPTVLSAKKAEASDPDQEEMVPLVDNREGAEQKMSTFKFDEDYL